MRSNRRCCGPRAWPLLRVSPGSLCSRHTSRGYSTSQPMPSRRVATTSRACRTNPLIPAAGRERGRRWRHCCSERSSSEADPGGLDLADRPVHHRRRRGDRLLVVAALDARTAAPAWAAGPARGSRCGPRPRSRQCGDVVLHRGAAQLAPPGLVGLAEQVRVVLAPQRAERQPALGGSTAYDDRVGGRPGRRVGVAAARPGAAVRACTTRTHCCRSGSRAPCSGSARCRPCSGGPGSARKPASSGRPRLRQRFECPPHSPRCQPDRSQPGTAHGGRPSTGSSGAGR